MKRYKLSTEYRKRLADTQTPVSIFLKLRDKFANSILLESSDYHGSDNSVSYICCQPIAGIEVFNGIINLSYPDGKTDKKEALRESVIPTLIDFISSFELETTEYKFASNGLFGYMGYDAVQYFEDVELHNDNGDFEIPEIIYRVYRFVVAIDHFKNEMHLFEHRWDPEQTSKLDELITLIDNKNYSDYHFETRGKEKSNYTDEEFLEILSKGRQHCLRGDVFQIVLSRRYSTKYLGDDFNVYRALRSINPSPYLFFFDYGNFRVFGSSPEAQIVIKDRRAVIHPIAGTFARTGNDQADSELAQKLFTDTKENSEHVMLVDLARNDLSKHGENVQVETFKEVQFYCHVIHLVSKVTAHLPKHTSPLNIVAETFPAGTLSGAPKYRAMQLINELENSKRGYYGGAIGYLGFNGDFNHAIMIRSFLSQKNSLIYQAGAGVVAKSNVENELIEVNNKLAALRKAIKLAEEI